MRDLGPEMYLRPTPVVPPATTLIAARDITLTVSGRQLIGPTAFDIRKGRRTMILGANGAGKSLLLRLIHGLSTPSSGQLLWDGRPLGRAERADQAMVFQRPVMLRRSVLANLRFALKVKGLPRHERIARECEALELARLAHHAHSPARVLSGGEQQRLAVARALVCRPKLLLLDEPTANLDPASTQAIETLIRKASEDGVTVVMVSHDAGQARRLGEDALFVHAGRVVEAGPAEKVLGAPASEPAAAWVEGRLYVDSPAVAPTA